MTQAVHARSSEDLTSVTRASVGEDADTVECSQAFFPL